MPRLVFVFAEAPFFLLPSVSWHRCGVVWNGVEGWGPSRAQAQLTTEGQLSPGLLGGQG